MTTIEYENRRVEVPDDWDEITLGKYERISGMRTQTARERAALIAEVCDVTVEVLLDWPAEIFNRIVEITGFLYRDPGGVEPSASIEIEGVKYVVPVGDKLTLGAWVDADEVQKEGRNVLSGILAITCRPVGERYDSANNEARQLLFAGLPVDRVMPVLAFFLQRKNAFERRIEAFSLLARGIDRLARSTAGSQGRGGGIRLSRIWRRGVCWILIGLLRYRWKRCLRSSRSAEIRTMRKRRSGN